MAPRGVRPPGRGKLWRANPKSGSGTKQGREAPRRRKPSRGRESLRADPGGVGTRPRAKRRPRGRLGGSGALGVRNAVGRRNLRRASSVAVGRHCRDESRGLAGGPRREVGESGRIESESCPRAVTREGRCERPDGRQLRVVDASRRRPMTKRGRAARAATCERRNRRQNRTGKRGELANRVEPFGDSKILGKNFEGGPGSTRDDFGNGNAPG